MLIDTHAHLQDNVYDQNIDGLIKNAQANNVKKIVCASYNLKSSIQSVDFANKYDCIYAVIGVHPENCEEYNLEVESQLEQLAQDKKVLAIGEIGLDYHYTTENKEVQKQAFISQIKLAHKLNLPIVIHSRDAIGDTLQIIRDNKDYIKKGGVFHCFNASVPVLEEIVKMGFYVSYGGAITFSNAEKLREIVASTPVDRILLETDCPYMSPVPYRGKVNEPKNIDLVIEKLSAIKNVDIQELEQIIENNAKNALNI
ncbi:MAG: TatD family hydrolase [Clostridia bacterium]|nr:TatD family hydrolase [Clostridia bacterium]